MPWQSKQQTSVIVHVYKNRKKTSINSRQQKAAGYVVIIDFRNTRFTERPPPTPPTPQSLCSLHQPQHYIWLVTLHSTVDRLRGGSLSPAEISPTPPDAWLPHGLHSGRALWLWGLKLLAAAAGFFPSYAPLTDPLSAAEAWPRCSEGTRGCRSSSSEMANTGTLTWSPSRLFPGWPLSGWRWGEGEEEEGPGSAGEGEQWAAPGALAGSAAAASRPKQGAAKRGRRRLLVELRRRCLWDDCVSGYEALLMDESDAALCSALASRWASEKTFLSSPPLPPAARPDGPWGRQTTHTPNSTTGFNWSDWSWCVYWRCPPAWWRDWWSSSCTTSYAAAAAEGGSPGTCARSTPLAWRRPCWSWSRWARRRGRGTASRPPGRAPCRCAAGTCLAAEREKCTFSERVQPSPRVQGSKVELTNRPKTASTETAPTWKEASHLCRRAPGAPPPEQQRI